MGKWEKSNGQFEKGKKKNQGSHSLDENFWDKQNNESTIGTPQKIVAIPNNSEHHKMDSTISFLSLEKEEETQRFQDCPPMKEKNGHSG